MEEVLSNKDLLAEIAAAHPRNLTFRAICKDWKAILEDLWTQEAERGQIQFIVKLFRNKPRRRFNRREYTRPYTPRSPYVVDPALSTLHNFVNIAAKYYRVEAMLDIICHPAMKADLLSNFSHTSWAFAMSGKCVGCALSMNPAITWKDILEHPEIPWDWDALSD